MSDGTMSPADRLDRLRIEIQAADFTRLSTDEAIALQRQYLTAHRVSVERGDIPPMELVAMFALFVEEKVPPDISQGYIKDFLNKMETV